MLFVEYKLGTMRLTEDLPLGAKMLAKNKMAILPEITKGRAEIAALFRESARGAEKGGDKL
jgi:hypothetical protein